MNLGKSTLGVLASNVANLVIGIGSSIFLTRTLGVVGKGEFAIFSAAIGLLALLAGFSLKTSISFFVAKDQLDSDRILTSLALFSALAFLVVSGVARANHVLFENEILLPLTRQEPLFELILAGAVAASIFRDDISSVFAGRRRFAVINYMVVAFSTVSFLSWLALFLLERSEGLDIGSGTVFVVYLVLVVSDAAAFAFLARRFLGLRFSPTLLRAERVGEMIRYSTKAWAAQLAQFLNYRVDIWIVQYFAGSAALGLYSLAGNLATMLWILPRSASRVLMPYVASGEDEDALERVARISRLALLLTACAGIVAALTARWWIELLYGSEFSGSSTAFVVLLLGCVPFSLSVVLGATLTGLDRLDENLVASVAGFGLTVVLDIALIPRYGIVGAAAASSSSYLLTTAIVVRALSREAGLPIRMLIVPRRGDITYLLHGLRAVSRGHQPEEPDEPHENRGDAQT